MGELDFAGRVALVTSAAAGLGWQYVKALASAGAVVVLTDADDDKGRRAAEEFRAFSLDVHFERGAASHGETMPALIDRTTARFGRLDILVNNPPEPATDASKKDRLRIILEEQVCPADAAMRAAIPHMRRQGYGRIVNCAYGVGAFAIGENTVFRAATAALFALTAAAALDHLDMDIRINAVAPLVASSLSEAEFSKVPLLDPQIFQASEVAPLVSFLAHADCRVTGQTFTTGGGRHASIWVSSAPGLFVPSASARDIGTNWSAIVSRDNAVAPVTPLDEMAMVVV